MPQNLTLGSCILGVVLFTYLISLLTLASNNRITEANENQIFYLFFSLIPVLASFILHRVFGKISHTDDSKPAAESEMPQSLIVFNAIALQIFFLLSFPPFFSGAPSDFFPRARIFCVVQLAGSLIIYFQGKLPWISRPARSPKLQTLLYTLTFIGLPLTLLAVCGNQYLTDLLDIYFRRQSFVWGMTFGGLLLGIVYFSNRLPLFFRLTGSRFHKFFTIATLVISIFIICLEINGSLNGFDNVHYSPYLGPATAVNAGYRPFIDVYSQYGFLSFLIPSFLFKWFIPASFSSLQLIAVSISTVQYLMIFAVAIKISRNKFLGILFGLGAVLAFLNVGFLVPGTFSGCSVCGTYPSGGGMRHLPLITTLFSLTLIKDRLFNTLSLTALAVASLWSAEQLVYSLALYCLFIIGRGVVYRQPLIWFARNLGKVILIPLGTFGCYGLLSKIVYGELPNLQPYLDQLAYFKNGSWSTSIEPHQLLFGLPAIAFFVVLCRACYIAWMNQPDQRLSAWRRTEPTMLLAAVGLFHAQYFVGRSFDGALIGYSLPLFVLGAVLIENQIDSFLQSPHTKPRSPAPTQWLAWSAALPLGIIFILSCGAIFNGIVKNGTDNAATSDPLFNPRKTIFSLLFFDHYSVAQLAQHWRYQLYEYVPPAYQVAVNFVREHAKSGLTIFLGADSLPVLTYAHRTNLLPIGHSLTDSQSKTLMEIVPKQLGRLKSGDLVLTKLEFLQATETEGVWNVQDSALASWNNIEMAKNLYGLEYELLRLITQQNKLLEVASLPNGLVLFRLGDLRTKS